MFRMTEAAVAIRQRSWTLQACADHQLRLPLPARKSALIDAARRIIDDVIIVRTPRRQFTERVRCAVAHYNCINIEMDTGRLPIALRGVRLPDVYLLSPLPPPCECWPQSWPHTVRCYAAAADDDDDGREFISRRLGATRYNDGAVRTSYTWSNDLRITPKSHVAPRPPATAWWPSL